MRFNAAGEPGRRKSPPPWPVAFAVPLITALIVHAVWLASRPPPPLPPAAPISQEAVGAPVRQPETLPALPSKSQMTYQEMFQEIAAQYGLDWRLLARQAYLESRLDPQAVGASGELGLMQILPSTWAEWAPKAGVSDPADPYSNVWVGAAYLAFLRGYFTGLGYPEDYWMLVAYNWGPRHLRELVHNNGGRARVPARRDRYATGILAGAPDEILPWGAAELDRMVTTSLTPGQLAAAD
ncbi:MAG: transglycosylase SLT domain-containing protein [Anaerolineae bacterium]